ncbi:MAG: bile acid:sodium symporter family protein [Planctomycetes bacterium]|nr:bile acid:sodium symporter family protein [Planctomycetota bacterium]
MPEIHTRDRPVAGWLGVLKKRWFLVALVAVGALGYLARGLAVHFPGNWSLATLAFTMCFVGLTANLQSLAQSLLNWKASALSLGMTYLAAPLAAYGVGWMLFGPGTELFQGCVLAGCAASTISSAIVYTRTAGGNHALSIVLSNLSNLISILVTPAMIGFFLHTQTPVDVKRMVVTLLIGVLLPIVVAQAVGIGWPEPTRKFRPVASVLAQVGILVVVFGTVCKTFHKARPEFYDQLPKAGGQLVLASLTVYIVLVRLSYWLSRRTGLNVPDSVAVSYASAQKTLAATVVLAEKFFSPTAALPMIIYHFVQLLYGGYDGERLKRLAQPDASACLKADGMSLEKHPS